MKNLFGEITIEDIKARREETKHDFEFQEIGTALEPIYGKLIWTLFYKPGFTEFKIKKAHEIAEMRGITNIKYLIGIIKKLPY